VIRPPFRPGRWGWAKAIQADKLLWGFKGIQHLSPKEDRLRKYNCLTASLLASQSYLDDLQNDEVDYIIHDADYDREWRDHVKWAIHRGDRCPHGSREERHAYGAAFRKTIKDESEKRNWAYVRVDYEWIKELVLGMTEQDVEGIEIFLKKHPVEEVWQASTGRWVDLTDVVVFCPECDEPIEDIEQDYPAELGSHRYGGQLSLSGFVACALCAEHPELGEHMACLFNHRGEPRKRFRCPSCSHTGALDAIEGSFLVRYGRPPDWPPGAPYPPRRGFLGEPMDVPPWQD
jgi:hypothetical protein